MLPPFVSKICSTFLCRQVLRPHGVAGFFSALFGEDVSEEEAPLQKLENVAMVLNFVPSNMTREVCDGHCTTFPLYLWSP